MAHLVHIHQLAPANIAGGPYWILTNTATGVPEYRPAISSDAGNQAILGTDRGVYVSMADIFLSSASFDSTTNILTLTLSDASTVTVDMTDYVGYNWTLAGDAGPNQTIDIGNTVSLLGANGFSVVTSATDTATITPPTGTITGQVMTWNNGTLTWGVDTVANLETTTTIAGALGAGNPIGTYTNEDAVAVILRETITDFLLSGSNLRFVDEAGVNNDVAISTLISTDGGNAVIAGGDGKLFVSAGAVVANLSLSNITASTIDVNIDTGADVTLPAVTTTTAGLMTAAFLNDLLDLITLSGVAGNATDLGTFTGVTIPDTQTIKQALQALETDLELQNALINVLDEGIDTGAGEVTSFDFVGGGVTATQVGGAVTVTIPGGGEATTVSDTATVDLTLTGVDITADVKISATAGNVITSDATGVLAKERRDQFDNVVNGTTTLTLTVAPMAGTLLKLFRNGVHEDPADYSFVGTTVTLVNAASTSVNAPVDTTDFTAYYWSLT